MSTHDKKRMSWTGHQANDRQCSKGGLDIDRLDATYLSLDREYDESDGRAEYGEHHSYVSVGLSVQIGSRNNVEGE